MATQNFVVFTVVLGSSLYAAWVLMPSALRRAVATRLLDLPHPAWLRRALQRATASGGGCNGCSGGGCDKTTMPTPSASTVPTEAPTQVIQFHPQRKF